jgi:bifunctional DNA-binding transcriptional regulator/antitoxin component of YhaV-PrlF toxin-antitoxin module
MQPGCARRRSMALTAKMTSKGQITVPKAIRQVLKGDVVEFQVVEGQVILKSVTSVGGALSKYAKKYEPIAGVRKKTWGKVVSDKTKD